MISLEFIDGAKLGLQSIRNRADEVQNLISNRDLAGAQKEIAILIGYSLNLQAMIAAKAVCELSKAEET